ncbi:unnamed protein product [Lepidochelys kempii]
MDVSSKTIQSLKFTVKETVCPVSEKCDINQCEFKEDGLVKDCSGIFSTEKDPPSVIIKCEEASEEWAAEEMVVARKIQKERR